MEIEWKNGDECVYRHQPDVTYMFVGIHPVNKKSAICWNEKEGIAQIHIDFISKPETPQQREERELCEDIDSAYDLAPDDLQIPVNLYVAQLLLQMGYRKQ